MLIINAANRITRPADKTKATANNIIGTDNSASTIKGKTVSCNNGNYEYAENYSPAIGIARCQDSPVTLTQANPTYRIEYFDRSTKPSVNLK